MENTQDHPKNWERIFDQDKNALRIQADRNQCCERFWETKTMIILTCITCCAKNYTVRSTEITMGPFKIIAFELHTLHSNSLKVIISKKKLFYCHLSKETMQELFSIKLFKFNLTIFYLVLHLNLEESLLNLWTNSRK